jgi:hypothetical protein
MRFPDPAKAKEFFDQKMIFTTGLVELNGMLKDENVNVVDVRAADDFRQRSCARRGKFAQGKMGRVTRAEEDNINVLYCYTQQCHLAANAALEFASRDELDVEK